MAHATRNRHTHTRGSHTHTQVLKERAYVCALIHFQRNAAYIQYIFLFLLFRKKKEIRSCVLLFVLSVLTSRT
ncbi:Uncharacterized protein APZ42_027499 [Daphnia magna]|uniref:Uncharacterized protein n=1 Tax=Daphnia magna TaxID=35525 RepID=A0A164RMG9_9CRUS|nr:Uncharacterized protein APZ42_027499 [Daphnia magna]